MEIDVPDWLTKELMVKAIKSAYQTNGINIKAVHVKQAVPKGTNFMCELYRVKVEYRQDELSAADREISLIVKSPKSGGLYDFVTKLGYVDKEMLVYKTYVPMLKDILSGDEDLTARSFYANDENNLLVLEDLNAQGYKMVNRLEQLDFEHTALLLKTLAKFHAASVKLHEVNPGMMGSVGKETCFHRDLKPDFEFLPISQINLFILEITDWPEMKEYVDVLTRLRDCIWQLMVDCFETDNDEFKVLNHGDCWVTNVLYKYDIDNQPVSIRLIDLQVARYMSPAADLIYVMHGSVQEYVRIQRYDELIDIYLKSLNENIDRFRCDTKKLERRELVEALEKRAFFEFYTNITLLPVVVNDDEQVMKIEEMTKKHIDVDIANNPFRRYYQTNNYRKLFIRRFINEFSKQKWFTDLKSDS